VLSEQVLGEVKGSGGLSRSLSRSQQRAPRRIADADLIVGVVLRVRVRWKARETRAREHVRAGRRSGAPASTATGGRPRSSAQPNS
jgi:hypothetical protein